MPSNSKSYVDSDGLSRFLTNLKAAYTNGAQGFTVKNATYATYAAGEDSPISTTYLKSSVAESTYTPLTRTIAGVSLENNISKDSLLTALGNNVEGAMEAGAQVNVLEGISFKGNGDSGFADLTITNKKAVLDLSTYAKLDDITRVMNFKGVVDYFNNIADVATPAVGDVWIVRYRGSSGTEPANAEYICTGTSPTVTWEMFGTTIILDGYATQTWVGQNYVSKSAYENDVDEIYDAIEDIYKAATPAVYYTQEEADAYNTAHHLQPGDAGYVTTETIKTPAAAESGVLVTKIAAEALRASNAESALDGRLDVLEGADTVTGSVAKSIKDAIGALDYGITGASGQQPAGDFVTGVTETDGIIEVSRASYSEVSNAGTEGHPGNTPPTALAVKTYVDGLVGNGLDALDLPQVGANNTASYVKLVSQLNGQVSAEAGAFDTTIGPATASGTEGEPGYVAAASTITAPTSMAVRTLVDSVTVRDQNSAIIDQMVPVSNATIDAMFPTTPSQGS